MQCPWLCFLLAPCAVVLLYPLAVFVMLARFYQRSALQLAQCMLEQVAQGAPPVPDTPTNKRRRKRRRR